MQIFNPQQQTLVKSSSKAKCENLLDNSAKVKINKFPNIDVMWKVYY